ncbi:hypothetical protein KQI84_15130 [bacterium]|nr:hypothetical protein [bacterium]
MIDRQVTTTDPRRQAWAFITGLPWRWILVSLLFIILLLISWQSRCEEFLYEFQLRMVEPRYWEDIEKLNLIDWIYWRHFMQLLLPMGICWVLWPKPLPPYQPRKALVFPTGNIRVYLRIMPVPVIIYVIARMGGAFLNTFFPVWPETELRMHSITSFSDFSWNLFDFLLDAILASGLFFAIVRMFRRKILIVLSAAAGVWALLWWYDVGMEISWIWAGKFPNMGWPAYILFRVPNLIALEATAILLMAAPARSRGGKALESPEEHEPNDEQSTQESP